MKPNFGWDLPPGCTHADIDRAMGGDDVECPDCDGENKECKRCNGTGVLDVAKERAEAAEDAADRAYDEWRDAQLEKDEQRDFAGDEPRDRFLDDES